MQPLVCICIKIRSNYLDKAHPDGAHLSELVHHLKTVVDWLWQQLGEQLVVEDLEAAATGDFAHSGGMEAMLVITVATLYENAAVTQALCVHLTPYIIQVHTCKYTGFSFNMKELPINY